jgi:hypothetical protein
MLIDVLPHKKRGNVYDWEFDKMIPGGIIFNPDTKSYIKRC